MLWMKTESKAEVALDRGQNEAEFCLRHQAFWKLRRKALDEPKMAAIPTGVFPDLRGLGKLPTVDLSTIAQHAVQLVSRLPPILPDGLAPASGGLGAGLVGAPRSSAADRRWWWMCDAATGLCNPIVTQKQQLVAPQRAIYHWSSPWCFTWKLEQRGGLARL